MGAQAPFRTVFDLCAVSMVLMVNPLNEVTQMARKTQQRPQAPQHDNLYSGLLWQTEGAWRGCFCMNATPNAKPDCSLRGESVRNLVVMHDDGRHIGDITIQPIESTSTDLAGTGVFKPVNGATVGLAVFYDHLRGRFQLKRQRQRPVLI